MIENFEIDGTKLPVFGATRKYITEMSVLRGKYMPIITIKLFGTSGLALPEVPSIKIWRCGGWIIKLNKNQQLLSIIEL
jgi:hypothetical protein